MAPVEVKKGLVTYHYLVDHVPLIEAINNLEKSLPSRLWVVKQAVKCATTTNISANYYYDTNNNKWVLEGTSNGPFPTIDGVTVTPNDRVLIKDQTDTSQNGIYVLDDVGSSNRPFKLSRATDLDENPEFTGNIIIPVLEGQANSSRTFTLTSENVDLSKRDGIAFSEIFLVPGGKVEVSSTDTMADYLQNKIIAGDNITITKQTGADGSEQLSVYTVTSPAFAGITINGPISQSYGSDTQTMLLHTSDFFSDTVISGLLPATSSTLTSDISAGVAYVMGRRIVKGTTSHTYTALKDTYVDLKGDGTYIFTEVDNGADAPPVAPDSIRLAKVITSATAITSVVDLRQLHKIVVDTSGNVGIGTTSPGYKLEVNGDIKGTNLISASLTSGSILFSGSNGLISQDNANLFWDNTNKRLGIGTTIPQAKLHITDSILITGQTNPYYALHYTGDYNFIRWVPATDNNPSYDGIQIRNAANTANKFAVSKGGTIYTADVLQVAGTGNSYIMGNVGIGTNPTNFKLQIDGNTGPNIDNTYDLGSTSYRWKSLYLGGGSLNIDQIGGTNYERLNIGYDTNNNRFQILTTTSGTGTLRPLYLTTGTNNGITIDVSGNVGIGTATPSQKLTVNGKLQIGDDSSPPIAGTIKWNGSNFLGYNGTVWLTLDAQPTSAAGWTADTGRVYLTTASDHVGIGIITYPQEKLVLSQGSNFAVEMSVPTGVTASTSSGGTLNGTYYYKISASDGIGWTILSSEVSATVNGGTTAGTINVSWSAVTGAVKYRVWRGTSSNGENSYYETTSTSIADNGSLTFTSGTPPTATTAYVNKISASGNSWILGNVGIGTSLPGNKFGITITSDDTVPALGSNGGSFALLKKVSNDPGNYGFLMGVLSSGNVFQQVQRIDGTATPYSLLLQPNGGNVGIGITSTPSERLEVNGNIKGTNLISTSLTSGSILFAGSNGLISQDNANLFWDNTNKRLGIGTTTPSQKLTVTGNIGLQAGANAFIGTLDNYTLSLRTNNTDRVFITSTGNVGIGTTTPSYPLHVVSGGTAAVCVTNVNTSASSYGIVSTTCYGWGVWGESSSGTGVYGVGDPQGVAGVGYNAGSRGVVGVSYTASSCGVVGVVFEVSSCGVVGVSCAANSCGVVGWGGNCAYDFYAAGPGTNYGPFTGAHDTIYSQGEFQPGDVVVVKEVRFKRCDGVSSIVPEISQTTIPCDKRVMGVYNVYLGCENCDHWVYKEGYTTQKFNWATVNSLGEGLVKVKENELGNIEIGDLLTTSDVPGFAMKQGDDIVHNYTLGKAAENIDWSTIQVDPEKGFKWTMVAVFYYAG